MLKRNLTLPVLLSLVIIGLTVWSYFVPGSLNWGYHFFGFLPLHWFLLYIAGTTIVLVYVLRGNASSAISAVSVQIWKRPIVAFVSLLLVFAGAAVLLRQRVPLLGDSFILINNIENTLNGTHDLITYREPLSTYFFLWMAQLLHTGTYPAIMNAFRLGEIMLGAGFIFNILLCINCFVADTRERTLAILFLLSGAYMQVFLGYAEVYSVELYFVSLYVAMAALWMRGKLPFYCIPLAFMVMVSSHYLTVLLLPSFILIAYYEYKENGIKNILIGCAGVALSLAILIIALGADLKRFIPPMTHSPFLSIFPASDNFEAYTMFSVYHLTDLISLGMLLASSSVILLMISVLSTKRGASYSTEMKFLFASVLPILLFAAAARFDLGMPNDWDTLAPYFLLVNLFALIWFLQAERPEKERTILLCLAIAAFNTLAWVGVNASESATVARTTLLGDRRIVSQEGFFQHTYHLENYYAYRGDIPSIVALWEQYSERYPKDEVGYKRAAEYLVKGGSQTNPKTMEMMERWLSLSPNNAEAKSALAKICVNSGEQLLRNSKTNEARQSFLRAIGLDSLTVMAYYNMGTMYLQNARTDSAIQWYSKAIKVDSMFLRSYDGLSVAYLRQGDNVSAVKILETAVGRDTTDSNLYFRLGQIYHRMGKQVNAVESMKRAARLGDPYAQDLLRNSNITW